MARVLSSIGLTAPAAPVEAAVDDSFVFTGTPGFTGSGGVQRYDMKWEVDAGAGFVPIAASGTGLTTADTNPLVNSNSASPNSITVDCAEAGSYTIRIVGAPVSGGSYTVVSATQTVEVSAGSTTHEADTSESVTPAAAQSSDLIAEVFRAEAVVMIAAQAASLIAELGLTEVVVLNATQEAGLDLQAAVSESLTPTAGQEASIEFGGLATESITVAAAQAAQLDAVATVGEAITPTADHAANINALVSATEGFTPGSTVAAEMIADRGLTEAMVLAAIQEAGLNLQSALAEALSVGMVTDADIADAGSYTPRYSLLGPIVRLGNMMMR